MTQLSDLRDGIREQYGLSSTDNNITDAVLTGFINRSLRKIASEHNWPWLQETTTFATVAGTSTYTPPADWIATRYLFVGNRPLEEVSVEDMGRYQDSSGTPWMWTIESTEIRLSPTPDSVETVKHGYLKIESVLSDPTDEPLIPAVFDYYLSHLACIYVANRLGDTQANVRWAHEAATARQDVMNRLRRSTGTNRVKARSDVRM